MTREKTSRKLLFSVAVCSLIFLCAGQIYLYGQLTTGNISGTVKDKSDAVLPGATVTVTNIQTGTVRTAIAGERGEYRVAALAVGSYEIQATLTGFQTNIRKGINLSVGQNAVIDFSLSVGNVAEHVTVTDEAPMIETTSATVSGLVDPKQMRDIPLNARSFIELVPLQTGAVFADAGTRSVTKGFGKKLSIVGTRYSSNSFLLDGADINDISGSAGSAAGTLAGVETVREFIVITNAYDAEYGRHTGGVISAVTKSGTNEFHGSLFEFLRNSKMDARNFFDKAKPAYKRNQFGAAVGGPLVKDRTFFFGSYEGLRERLAITRTFNVPGLAARSGVVRGQTFAIDPAIRPYLDSYPLPNTPDRADGTAQFVTAYSQPTNEDFVTGRIDHRLSDSDSIFGRFTLDDGDQFQPGQSGVNTSTASTTGSRYATIEETHIFSPGLLSRTHFSFSRTSLRVADIAMEGATFPRFSFSDDKAVPGVISVSGLSNWGGNSGNPKHFIQNTYQFKEDFTYARGPNSFKFGGQMERFQVKIAASSFYGGGQFDFTSLGDFLTNNVNAAHFIRPGSDDIRDFRQNLYGFYFHDDIKLRSNFTLNIGVRYEAVNTPTEVNGKLATIRDIRPQHLYSVRPDQTDVGEPYFRNPSLKNFAPRVGFAWVPFSRTSVRGGFGVYHDQILPSMYQVSGVRVPPFFTIAEMFRENLIPLDQTIQFPNAYTSQRELLVRNIGSLPQGDLIQWDLSQPYVMKWSLNVEREFPGDITLEAGYAGTRGVHLIRGNLQLNATPSEVVNGQRYILITQPLMNPYWGNMGYRLSDGTSDYHSLQLAFKKRFSRGFQVQSSYTFSKSTDDSSTWSGGTDYGGGGLNDRAGYLGAKEHALSSFDVRHSYFTNFVYELPAPNWAGAARKLVSGWSASGILRLNSGSPLNPVADQPQQGAFSMRNVAGSTLNLIPGGNQNAIRPRNPNQYFDVSQYSFPAPFLQDGVLRFVQGNLGRNTLIGPGVANLDFVLIKDTPFREQKSLQFRAEFFNILNRANFGFPANRVFDRNGALVSTAGQITSTRTPSRQIQLALKLVF